MQRTSRLIPLGLALLAFAASPAGAQVTLTPTPQAAVGPWRGEAAAGPGGAQTGGLRLTPDVDAALRGAMDAAKAKDWARARARLQKARDVADATDADRFETDVVASFIAVNTGDHPTALASYQRIIASPLFGTGLAPQEQAATLRNAIVLANEAGDYAGAIAIGNRLIAAGKMDDGSAVVLALAYFASGDLVNARTLAQKAIDAELAAGMKPDNAALQIVSKSNSSAPGPAR